jgi:tetratricopeptide (TPR) repeat protein
MKKYKLSALSCFLFLAPSLFAQTAVTAPAPIPEEARKHFVMGETMFKEAKSAVTFSQAAGEFTEAARLAPQWPEARYNLALAKESAGDYSGAMADLKLYQQFKLSDAEARTVQDKIYTIEARQKMEVSDAAAKVQAKADSTRDAFIKSILGDWKSFVSSYIISISRANDGNVIIKSTGYHGENQPVSDVSITGTILHFVVRTQYGDSDTWRVLDSSVSLGINGNLSGPVVQHWAQGSDHVSDYNNIYVRQ